jgi:hypothetical protein
MTDPNQKFIAWSFRSSMLTYRIYPDRHNSNQLQSRLTTQSNQKNISSTLEFQSTYIQADGSQDLPTASSLAMAKQGWQYQHNLSPKGRSTAPRLLSEILEISYSIK